MSDKKLKITLVKSTICCNDKQVKVVESLGLRRIRDVKFVEDTPAVRGMINAAKHLLGVEQA